jgi:hypothetical protein
MLRWHKIENSPTIAPPNLHKRKETPKLMVFQSFIAESRSSLSGRLVIHHQWDEIGDPDGYRANLQ